MADTKNTNSTYYDIPIRGAAIEESLKEVPNKLNKERDTATDLKVVYVSFTDTTRDLVVNNDRLTRYVTDYIKFNSDNTRILINNVSQPLFQTKQSNFNDNQGKYPLLLSDTKSDDMPTTLGSFKNTSAAFSSKILTNPATGELWASTLYSGNKQVWTEHEPITQEAPAIIANPLNYGSSFTVIAGIEKDNNGHIKKLTQTTFTLPKNYWENDQVKQNETSTNAEYPLLFSSEVSSGFPSASNTGEVNRSNRVLVNPAQGIISAYKFREYGMLLEDKYAPKNHAVSDGTYGLGTISNYGHVKLSNDTLTTSSTNIDGVAAGIGHKHSQYLVDHQAIKTLTFSGGSSEQSTETITGSGTINLHNISKTGDYNDLNNAPQPTKFSYNASTGTLTIIATNTTIIPN